MAMKIPGMKSSAVLYSIGALLASLILFDVATPASTSASEYVDCSYNKKTIACSRSFPSTRTFTIKWADGIKDTYKLQTSSGSVSIWRDPRGGTWHAISYGDSVILKNNANGNTIIYNGTYTRCKNEWQICN